MNRWLSIRAWFSRLGRLCHGIRRLWDGFWLAGNRLGMGDSRLAFALWAGFLGGCVSVLVDIDHFSIFWSHPKGRIAHSPLLIIALFVSLYCCTCIGGLLTRLVLTRAFQKPNHD